MTTPEDRLRTAIGGFLADHGLESVVMVDEDGTEKVLVEATPKPETEYADPSTYTFEGWPDPEPKAAPRTCILTGATGEDPEDCTTHEHEDEEEEEEVGISIEVEGWLDLKVSDVWPDGDQPDKITAEAVAAVMRKCGKLQVVRTWGVLEELTITVNVEDDDGLTDATVRF